MKTMHALSNLYTVFDIDFLDDETAERLNNNIDKRGHFTPSWFRVYDKEKALASLNDYRNNVNKVL